MPTIQLAYTASIGYAKTGEEVLRGPLRIWVACMLRQRIPYSKRATEKLRSLVPGFLEVDLSLKPPAQEGGPDFGLDVISFTNHQGFHRELLTISSTIRDIRVNSRLISSLLPQLHRSEMNPVSTQTCDELTVCTEMDGKWFVSVVIDCSWHPDGALLVAAIGDHELRKSIELLIESHEETIGEYKYLNSMYRNNWEVVSFEMDKLAADNVQLRNAVRDLQDSMYAARACIPNDDMRLEALRKTLDDGINTTRLALLQNRFGMFQKEGPVSFLGTK
ncbi:hypothetical protein BKA70DRAFT_1222268 [Coprinopsis sp. MPI-PUGE-AT-0042]|nr:hypothetical protein BKA70DRAFT_1222268 [Coprinopsis sp. MPI-PUGE-AT-0042]